MMTCAQLTELVTDYLEGRLTFPQRLAFQMHLGMCQHCRAYLGQMRQTVRLTGRVPSEPMPDEVKAELLERFRDWKANPEATADEDDGLAEPKA